MFITRMKKFVLTIRRPRRVQILVALMLSVTWVVGFLISLPPLSNQIDCCVVVFWYCFPGVGIIVLATTFLYSIDDDFFGSLRAAAPLGAVFVAIIGLFGYLISAERKARQPFLEKQLENCMQLAEAAGELANSPGADANQLEWEAAWKWEAASTRLSLFSDANFENIQQRFLYLRKHKNEYMNDNALCVVRMCRVMVHVSWSIFPGIVREDPTREPVCHQFLNNTLINYNRF